MYTIKTECQFKYIKKMRNFIIIDIMILSIKKMVWEHFEKDTIDVENV